MVLHLKCIFKTNKIITDDDDGIFHQKMHATIITRKGKSVCLLIKFLQELDLMC